MPELRGPHGHQDDARVPSAEVRAPLPSDPTTTTRTPCQSWHRKDQDELSESCRTRPVHLPDRRHTTSTSPFQLARSSRSDRNRGLSTIAGALLKTRAQSSTLSRTPAARYSDSG